MLAPLLKLFFSRYAKQANSSALDPEFYQRSALKYLRKELAPALIANKLGFQRCNDLQSLKELVPQNDDSYAEYFAELYRNGNKITTPLFCKSPIVAIGRTSGTSGKAKLIPLSEELLKSFDRTLMRLIACILQSSNMWGHYFRGQKILLGSRRLIEIAPCGLPVCDISGLLPARISSSIRNKYLPLPKDTFESDWSKKIDKLLCDSRRANVTAITGVPALIDQFFQNACQQFGVQFIDENWPELETIVYGSCHLDEDKRRALSNKWLSTGRQFHFAETYFATEGAFGFSTNYNLAELNFNLLENLYLFKNSKGLFLAHELEAGETYSILVTTPGGLINYQMGDLIKIISTSPLRFFVVGRENDEISLTGERISIEQLNLTLKKVGLVDGSYAPLHWVETEPELRLVWALPESEIARAMKNNVDALDAALCEFNVLYCEALRVEKVIRPSRVEIVSPTSLDTT